MENLSLVYDNTPVRRQDRLLEIERAKELLADGEYGFLAIGGDKGYGIPMNYTLGGDCIYFHCAPEGEKLRRLAVSPESSFCIVGRTAPEPSKFTTEYESVMVFGRLEEVKEETEKREAMRLLLMKYSPEFIETGLIYAEKSLHRTLILKLRCERISGKNRKTIP